MKINELIEKYKNCTDSNFTIDITVKNYLPFSKKKALAQKVIDKCKVVENGIVRVNEIDKYIVFTIEVINAYTELQFSEDMDIAMSEYDDLCIAGLLNPILDTFKEEYKIVFNFVNMEMDYVMQSNVMNR